MHTRIGINGFGRIGRATFRAAHEQGANVEWVGINDVMDIEMLAHLLRHDSVYGPYEGEVEVLDGAIRVDDREIPVYAETIRRAAMGRGRRRGRHRVHRAVPRSRRRGRAPPRRARRR